MAEAIICKTCIDCQQTKLSTEFHRHRHRKSGLTERCKDCANKVAKARRDRTKPEGDFIVPHIPTKHLTRLFTKIGINTTRLHQGAACWEWTGYAPHGYGVTTWNSRPAHVHRVIYAWLMGPIPPYHSGAEIDHLCKNTRCCNPLHLEIVTSEVNMARIDWTTCKNKLKTHCERGHEFTPENTVIKGKTGHRGCRQCIKASRMRTYRKSRQKPEWIAKQNARRHDRYLKHEKPIQQAPEWRAREQERRRERMKDPAYQAKARAWHRAADAKRRQDPTFRQKERERSTRRRAKAKQAKESE